MAVAGKVAITLSTENGGAWSASVTYDRLVAVTHNNNLYISRKAVANVEPPNDEYWFLALEGFSGDDIQAILDGTTQVGNAKTLDGHGAEYFFPKSGGTVTGNIVQDNGKRSIVQSMNSDGLYQLYDNTNRKNIIYSEADGTTTFGGTANGNLPLKGGFLTDSQAIILRLLSTSTDTMNFIKFYKGDSDTEMGCLGFSNTGEPSYRSPSAQNYTLLHTGNKPTGTYTGNGSATSRTVNIGGVGNIVAVYSNNTVALVGFGGFVAMQGGTVVGKTDAYVTSGKLLIANTDACLNANGVTYTYQVL